MSSLFTGSATIVPNFNPKNFEDAATQTSFSLGCKITDTEGCEYRYARFAGNLTRGQVAMATAPVAAHAGLVIAAAVTVSTALPFSTPVTTITLTNGATAVVANEYAGGEVTVVTGTSLGYTYQIESNSAAAASGVITLTLVTPVQVDIPALSTLTLTKNRFDNVIVASTSAVEVLGVVAGDVTSGQYGFVQVKGPAAVIAGAGVTAGFALKASTTTAGSVENASAVTGQTLGTAIAAITSGNAGLVNLNIS